jgi:hypothetical protein
LKIIEDINHHVGYTQLVHLYGLKDIDAHITLQQNVTVKLRELLLNLRDPQSSTRLFCQIEKEADNESILCAFDSNLYDTVMANLPNISLFIHQCIIEPDWKKKFLQRGLYSISSSEGDHYKRRLLDIENHPPRHPRTHIIGTNQDEEN